nr:nidogen-like domain-containing protein [Sphingomonas azotifigens]
MIAPFWADVDTRCSNCGAVYLGSRSSNSFTVTWNNVGYFATHSDKLNNFQLTLTATPGNTGDFDIEFRYDRLQWTTGDASGGSQGLGGVPAQAGFDAGDGQHFYSLPGSFSSTGALNFANITNITNVTNGQPGEYRFSIRNGTVLGDGSSPAAPIQPTTTGFGHYSFTFDILPNQRIYIDPIVAVGYDYLVAAGGPNILSVLLPDLGDPDGYAVYLLSDLLHPFASYVGARGNPFLVDFSGVGGVRGFRVAGINPALGLDPANTAAFVAGLTFDVTGQTSVSMTQTALPFDTSGPSVPEPATWAMLLSGFGLIGTALRRRRAAGWAPATA